MVTDQQVRKLMKLVETEKDLSWAAAKAGMCEKTARKYARPGELPSASAAPHAWRTRADPFAEVWEEMAALLDDIRESNGTGWRIPSESHGAFPRNYLAESPEYALAGGA